MGSINHGELLDGCRGRRHTAQPGAVCAPKLVPGSR